MAGIGDARVSSTGQSLEIQLDHLRAAGCEELFAEKKSGTTRNGREQLDLALKFARKGDVFVICRLDRLARSIIDLRKIIDQLDAKQVGFRCLQQGGVIDTTRADGRLMLNILGAFAEFETEIRKEQQRDGIEKATHTQRRRASPASDVQSVFQSSLRPTFDRRCAGTRIRK